MREPTVAAVAFDAVGTLIHPEPSAAEAYAAVGRRFGSRYSAAVIAGRFRAAFAHEEDEDRRAGLRTSEAREMQRWRNIVGRVLDDVSDTEACFEELFEHFARPESWRCAEDVVGVLEELGRRGLLVAMASNYDSRLRRVLAGLPELQALTEVLVISAEVGWRKPAAGFFEVLCQRLSLPPTRVLFVGDDLANDFEGARLAGLPVLLLDTKGKEPVPAECRIASLRELL